MALDFISDKWHRRGLEAAILASTWSKDPSTQCGAAIMRPDKTIASMGYNGFPKGCSDDPEIYADRELKYSRVVHAEVNAVLHCLDAFPLDGYTMFTWPGNLSPSCDRCTGVVIQSGITKVVHIFEESGFSERWRIPCERALDMYQEAGVEVITYAQD